MLATSLPTKGHQLSRIETDPLHGWRQQVRRRLGAGPLRLESPADALHAHVLWAHGRLLQVAAGDPGELVEDGPAELARKIAGATARAARDGHTLPLDRLSQRFGLDDRQRTLMVLALARAVAPGTAALMCSASGSPRADQLTVALAQALLGEDQVFAPPRSALFGRANPIVAAGLLRVECPLGEHGAAPIDRIVRAHPALISWVLGAVELSDPLAEHATLALEPRTLLDLVVDAPIRRRLEGLALSLATVPARGIIALISGGRGCGRGSSAEAVAGSAGRPLLRASLPALATTGAAGPLLAEVYVHAELTGAVVCLDDADVLAGEAAVSLAGLLERARRYRGLTVLSTTRPESLLNSALEGATALAVHLERPDATLREQLWEQHLPDSIELDGDPQLGPLSWQYELTGAQIRNAVAAGVRSTRGTGPLTAADLRQAAAEQLPARLEGAPARRACGRGLESLVLPEDAMLQIRELVDACRARAGVLEEWGFGRTMSTGKGIVALFSGEPGTGKTFCAELLAGELDLSLRVVSIPQVMSKWVGETEKNIARLFDNARAQGTLLVFDEADALFTSRVSSVERGSDRDANMRVNQLLQEIDRFDGIVVLTTNLKKSMDQAFQRRIGFHVEFPSPDAEQRRQIWRTLLPPEAPLAEDVDLDVLADQFDLSGGHIKNILLRAAYRARARGTAIDRGVLQEVAEQEFRATGRLYRRAD